MALNVGSLWGSLSLNISNFLSGLAQASAATQQTASTVQKNFNKTTSGVNNATNSVRNFSQNTTSGMKNLKRMASGIIFAQLFYRTVNAIEDGAKAMINFQNNMRTSAVALEYFLGSADKAQGFLNVMKDFAAVTPYTTEEAVSQSRRLMAMGFAAEEVKSVMQILTDASAATGGTTEQMERIVLALGQMKTNGKLAAQEIRQLAEAGIPSYKILQEQLGLTKDQLAEIGDYAIDGDTAVAAILQGLEQRYKGASSRIANEIPGMMSTIKDDLLLVSEQIFQGAYNSVKGFITKIRDGFEEARQVLRESGLGGLFEWLVPAGLQDSVRTIIASIQVLLKSVKDIIAAFGPLISTILQAFIKGLAAVLPIIAAVAQAISYLVQWVLQATPAVKFLASAIASLLVAKTVITVILWLVKATKLLTVAAAVAEAVKLLAKGIQTLWIAASSHPVAAIITIIAAALLTLALSSKEASAWLDGVMQKLGSLAGFNINDVLQPDDEDPNAYMDAFNKEVKKMNENLKNTGKEAEKSGKKVKEYFVAAFDELYLVPDKLDGLTSLLDSGLDIPDFGNLFKDKNKDKTNEDPDWAYNPPDEDKPRPPAVMDPDRPDKLPPAPTGKAVEGWQTMNELINTFMTNLELSGVAVGRWCEETSQAMGEWATNVGIAIDLWVEGALQSIDSWAVNTGRAVSQTVEETARGIDVWSDRAAEAIATWTAAAVENISKWATVTATDMGIWIKVTASNINNWVTATQLVMGNWLRDSDLAFRDWVTKTTSNVANWVTTMSQNFANAHKNMMESVWTGLGNIFVNIGTWVDAMGTNIRNFVTGAVSWIGNLFAALGLANGVVMGTVSAEDAKKKAAALGGNAPAMVGWAANNSGTLRTITGITAALGALVAAFFTGGLTLPAVAPFAGVAAGAFETGGYINREQYILAGEKNRREVVIPLENETYMRPFAVAVANLLRDMMPQSGTDNGNPVIYVEYLIADEYGLKELERRLQVVRIKESRRR